MVDRDTIGAGHETDDLHGLEPRSPRIDRVGPHVADDVGAQAQDVALLIHRDLRIDGLVKRLARRGKVLHAIARPLHRPAKIASHGANQNFLGIERALAAKTSAHVRSDDAHAIAGNAQDAHQRIAHDARASRRRMQGERAAASVVLRQAGAVFDRHRGLAVKPQARAHRDRRVAHHGIDITAAKLSFDQHVGACRLMEQRRAVGCRLTRIDQRGQRRILDLDQLRRILCDVATLRDHGHDGLAHESHLASGERQDRRGVIIGHARNGVDRLDLALEISGDIDSHDAGQIPGRLHVDRHDVGVGLVAAPECHVQQARHLDIVDILALPAKQARILGARNARAHQFRPVGQRGRPAIGFGCHVQS